MILDSAGINALYRLLYQEYGPRNWWPAQSNFEMITGAIWLTQNTAWRNVERALLNLKQAHALSADRILAMQPHALSALIRPSGYFNVKTRRLRAMCEWLVDNGGHAGLDTLATTPICASHCCRYTASEKRPLTQFWYMRSIGRFL